MRGPGVFGCALMLSGCFTARYLGQAALGQIELIARSKPLSTVIARPQTPPRLQKLLARVGEVKTFGEASGLKPTANYERYSDLHRAAAVWVVQACQSLAFEPKRWSFPIAGTVPYLGFFDERAAHDYARLIEQAEELDVDVRGASAYSTLGWFKDPVLSTMVSEGPEAMGFLANTVLHESVHATLYVPGQSSFNESLASFVADKLTLIWLQTRVGAHSPELKSYVEAVAATERRVRLMHQAYETLDGLYRSETPAEEKRARKAEVLAQLMSDLPTRKTLNNATLAGFRTYDSSSVAFERLLQRCGGDLTAFLTAVRTLEASSFPSSQMEDFGPVIDAL